MGMTTGPSTLRGPITGSRSLRGDGLGGCHLLPGVGKGMTTRPFTLRCQITLLGVGVCGSITLRGRGRRRQLRESIMLSTS